MVFDFYLIKYLSLVNRKATCPCNSKFSNDLVSGQVLPIAFLETQSFGYQSPAGDWVSMPKRIQYRTSNHSTTWNDP